MRIPNASPFSATLETLRIAMRDDVYLATDVLLPIAQRGPFAAVVIRTPYNRHTFTHASDRGLGSVQFFIDNGYAVVLQDLRGTHESEGDFFPYALTDRTDGEDLLSWINDQAWSNGRVAFYGCSYPGEMGHHLAWRDLDGHVCDIAKGAGGVDDTGPRWCSGFVRGGALRLASAFDWHWFNSDKAHLNPSLDFMPALCVLPANKIMVEAHGPATEFENWVAHAENRHDPYWAKQAVLGPSRRLKTPTLHVNSWFDTTIAMTLDLFQRSAEDPDAQQYLVIAPGNHCESETSCSEYETLGRLPLGDTYFPYLDLYGRWLSRWLRDDKKALEGIPRVQYFVLGKNIWKSTDRWPPAGIQTAEYFLSSGGNANASLGDGTLVELQCEVRCAPDQYRYTPVEPVPASFLGEQPSRARQFECGGIERNAVRTRQDVLVYQTAPLAEGLEITGTAATVLYVSCSAPDTDIVVHLCDVRPDGNVFQVQDGIAKLKFRLGYEHSLPVKPHEIVCIVLDLNATSYWFGPGHSIAIDVTSSCFPRYIRSLNGGGDQQAGDKEGATVTVHHSAAHPSKLVLPVQVEPPITPLRRGVHHAD